MALQDIITRMNTDIITELDGVDPTIDNSFFKSLVVSLAGRFNESYGKLELLLSQIFLLSAEGDFTDEWAAVKRITRLPAHAATGLINIVGVASTIVPINTVVQSSQGLQYKTNEAATITPSDITGAANVAGVLVTVTSVAHGLATGMTVNIQSSSGAPVEIIGPNITINDVIDADTFTYSVLSPPGDGPQGSVRVLSAFAVVSVTSLTLGSATNLASGVQLSLAASIIGVSPTAYVALGGITGGADVETSDALRARVVYAFQHPIAYGSVSYYENLLLSFPGITRVWVLPTTPAVGQITIYYVRDGQAGSILPSPSDLLYVRSLIPTPAELRETDIIVSAPTLLPVNFTFTTITPSANAPIQDSVRSALSQFFAEGMKVASGSTVITQVAYTRPILSAVDINTGNTVTEYSLTNPTGDITIAAGTLATLGTVVFP